MEEQAYSLAEIEDYEQELYYKRLRIEPRLPQPELGRWQSARSWRYIYTHQPQMYHWLRGIPELADLYISINEEAFERHSNGMSYANFYAEPTRLEWWYYVCDYEHFAYSIDAHAGEYRRRNHFGTSYRACHLGRMDYRLLLLISTQSRPRNPSDRASLLYKTVKRLEEAQQMRRKLALLLA